MRAGGTDGRTIVVPALPRPLPLLPCFSYSPLSFLSEDEG